MGVHESTISRELKRILTFVRSKLESWQYKPDYAQDNANQNHKNKNKFRKLTAHAKSFIIEKLQQNWSPDLMQVALSIKAGKMSSSLLLRKLSNYSRKNRLYRAFQELGYVI